MKTEKKQKNQRWSISLFLLSALFLLSGCSDNDIIPPPYEPYEPDPKIEIGLSVQPAILHVGAAGGTYEVQINATGIDISEIEYAVGEDWVTLSKNDDVLTISVEQSFVEAVRTTIVTLSYDDLAPEVRIIQAAHVFDGTTESTQIRVVSGWATSYAPGHSIENAFDGDFTTFFNSQLGVVSNWPFLVEFTLESTAERLDYIIYHPRPSGFNAWGGFNHFYVYASTRENPQTFTRIADITRGDANHNPTRIMLGTPVENPHTVRFVVNSGYNNRVSAAEVQFFKAATNRFDVTTIFTCGIATELRPEVTEADIRRIPDAALRRLATALLNNEYCADFRVGSFRPFQHPRIRAAENRTLRWSIRDNPTGIFVQAGEELVILVGETRGRDILILVNDLYRGFGAAGSRTLPLFEGMNRIRMPIDGLIYVMNLTDDDIPLILETADDKARAAAKTVDIHFVFGQVQGYFDITRHTNADWARLLRDARFRDIDIVGIYSHATWPVAEFRRDNTTDIIWTVNNLDNLVYQQQVFVGLQKFDRMYRNRMYFYALYHPSPGVAGLAHNYGTGYARGAWYRLSQPNRFVNGIWIFGHEVGHMSQNRPGFNWRGMGEISVNVYTKYNQRRFGGNPNLMGATAGYATWYDRAISMFHNQGIPHFCPTIENQHFPRLVPFWQLHLYLVEARGQTDFWKDLHEELRITPIPQPLNYGLVQLDFVRHVSRISGLNMVDFFKGWGLLTPIVRPTGATFAITQEDVDAVIADINSMGLQMPHANIHLIRESNINDFR